MKPPLHLYVEVTTPDGRQFRWDPDAPDAKNRPQNIRFRTARFDGFKDGGCELPRRLDRDHTDINLADDFKLIGRDGDTAYEGYIAAHPGDTTDGHRVNVSAIGWMAHAKDRKIAAEVLVDSQTASWQPPRLARRAHLGESGYLQGAISARSDADGLSWDLPEQVPNMALAELWYTAPPGAVIARMQYRGSRVGAWTSLENPTAYGFQGSQVAGLVTTAGLTLDDAVHEIALGDVDEVLLRALNQSGSALTPAAGHQQRYPRVAMYGNHRLPLHAVAAGEPAGIHVSEAIRYLVAKYAPMLKTAHVKDTTYPLPHSVIREAYLYDALLRLNAPHQWGLEVWEDRHLHFAGVDLTDYDWQIRLDQPGVGFAPAGTSLDELANAVQVFYTDRDTGTRQVLRPEDHSELRDDTVGNAWNRARRTKTIDLQLTIPTIAIHALQLGRASLAEHNYPRGAGTLRATGHIHDRAGNLHPVWKVRAGQTIAIVDHPNDAPRLIVETDYRHTNRQLQIAVGLPFKATDAVLDRITTGLEARGLL